MSLKNSGGCRETSPGSEHSVDQSLCSSSADLHHSKAAKWTVRARVGPTKLSVLMEFDILQYVFTVYRTWVNKYWRDEVILKRWRRWLLDFCESSSFIEMSILVLIMLWYKIIHGKEHLEVYPAILILSLHITTIICKRFIMQISQRRHLVTSGDFQDS